MGRKKKVCRLLVGNPEGRDHLKDQDIGGWIILRLIFGR
jgi:hypothetical protein